MVRKKKLDPRQNIFDLSSEVILGSSKEGPFPSIIVGSVNVGTLLQLEIPGSNVIVVNCGMCQREIWTEYYQEGLNFICETCCQQLPR
jgi:hypothetical protein